MSGRGHSSWEILVVQKALHIRTTVHSGGKVEFDSPELKVGQTVGVVVRPINSA
jgi:hypothetical protein